MARKKIRKINRADFFKVDYYIVRMNAMNNEIRYWTRRKEYSRTISERELCSKMCAMYYKRYHWYMAK